MRHFPDYRAYRNTARGSASFSYPRHKASTALAAHFKKWKQAFSALSWQISKSRYAVFDIRAAGFALPKLISNRLHHFCCHNKSAWKRPSVIFPVSTSVLQIFIIDDTIVNESPSRQPPVKINQELNLARMLPGPGAELGKKNYSKKSFRRAAPLGLTSAHRINFQHQTINNNSGWKPCARAESYFLRRPLFTLQLYIIQRKNGPAAGVHDDVTKPLFHRPLCGPCGWKFCLGQNSNYYYRTLCSGTQM